MNTKVFILENCPHCIRMREYLNELLKEEKYRNIEIEMIDESKNVALANSYDYYYVPTFFFNDEKIFEGSMTYEDVRTTLDKIVG